MKKILVPFHKPHHSPMSKKYVNIAARSAIIRGDGPFSKEVCNWLANQFNCDCVLLTPSCTSALELALIAINLSPGDEVIVPSFNFTSIGTAITKLGGIPVFADIEMNSGNISLRGIENLISSKTRAICWVNYSGGRPDYGKIMEIAKRFNLITIEDNAHGIMGAAGGIDSFLKPDFVAFSFHETKNIQCGEGGALLVYSDSYKESAHIAREKGTNRRDFKEGKVEKYHWISRGGSELLSDLSSAFLLGQIDSFNKIADMRRSVYRAWKTCLQGDQGLGIYNVLQEDDNRDLSSHFYPIIFKDSNLRDKTIEGMRSKGFELTSHYQPLHTSPAGIKYGRGPLSTLESSVYFSSGVCRFPINSQVPQHFENMLEAFFSLIENIQE